MASKSRDTHHREDNGQNQKNRAENQADYAGNIPGFRLANVASLYRILVSEDTKDDRRAQDKNANDQ